MLKEGFPPQATGVRRRRAEGIPEGVSRAVGNFGGLVSFSPTPLHPTPLVLVIHAVVEPIAGELEVEPLLDAISAHNC